MKKIEDKEIENTKQENYFMKKGNLLRRECDMENAF